MFKYLVLAISLGAIGLYVFLPIRLPQQQLHYPVISEHDGRGPWQVITYSGDEVKQQLVHLDAKDISTRSESVYLSNKSQFIYRNGEPIKAFGGNLFYWDDRGNIINQQYQIIPEDEIFVVNGRPMPKRTAMMLKNF